MNPYRIAGESERDNFLSNVVIIGMKDAIFYDRDHRIKPEINMVLHKK